MRMEDIPVGPIPSDQPAESVKSDALVPLDLENTRRIHNIGHATAIVPTGTEATSSKGFNRRRFLQLTGLAAGGILAGFGLNAVLQDDSPVPVPQDTLAGNRSDSSPATTIESQPGKQEKVVGPEIKDKYSLSDLVAYSRNTVFGEQSPQVLTETMTAIQQADNLVTARRLTAEAMSTMTGRELVFNHIPGTPDTLPDTRLDPDPFDYQYRLASFVGFIGILPKKLGASPDGYNVIEDFLPETTADGRDSVNRSLSGVVSNNGSTSYLSMDMDNLNFPTLAHELQHVHQYHIPKYSTEGEYAKLRAYGAENIGSPAEMLVSLQQKLNSGEIDRVTYELAQKLIYDQVALSDSSMEDASYTLGNTIESGLLEKTDDELIDHLRQKQIQVLKDMSDASGVDFGVVLAYRDRFPMDSHPKVLASIADAGIIEQMSPHEGGPLATGDEWTAGLLSPNSYFVNIGTLEQPQIVMLTSSGTSIDPTYPDQADGIFDVYLAIDRPSHDLDMRETPPSTTTTTMPDVNAIVDDTEQLPVKSIMFTKYPELEEISRIIAPGQEVYDGAVSGGDLNQKGRLVFKVAYDANELWHTIDRSRLVGRISLETGMFEKF